MNAKECMLSWVRFRRLMLRSATGTAQRARPYHREAMRETLPPMTKTLLSLPSDAFFWHMTLRGNIIWTTLTSLILAGGILAAPAASTNAPDFKEVYGLLLAHLPGATDESLNQTAVAGLLSQLNGRAELISKAAAPATNALPVRAAILNQSVAYLRVSQVTDDLAVRIGVADQLLSASNKLIGTVLDLRFAAGDATGTVKASADLLAAPKTPVIVLINGATSGAAEVLAAELRDTGALLIGNPTAGLAMTMTDFPLANGQHLRVATTPIQWHGADLAALQPDILVKTGLDEDRDFMERPYGLASQTGNDGDTNGLAQLLDHTSEADLVRQKRKDGNGNENPEPPAKTESVQPVLRDPALARAVDLVEGLAVVRVSHP